MNLYYEYYYYEYSPESGRKNYHEETPNIEILQNCLSTTNIDIIF